MNKILLIPIVLCLSSCIGTRITGREHEIDKPYPDLHSVPDRPKEVDFAQINQEMINEEDEQVKMLEFNRQLRSKYGK